MHMLLKRTLLGVGLLVIVSIFGFGAKEALALTRSHAAAVCENYPNCSSEQECDECCDFLGHDEGFCTMGGACLCS